MASLPSDVAAAAGVVAAGSADVGLQLDAIAFMGGFLRTVTGDAKFKTYLVLGAAAVGVILIARKVLK